MRRKQQMPKKPEKLIVQIIEAMREHGLETSNEIAGHLGRPVANVSATMSEMKDSGLLRETGRYIYVVGPRGQRKRSLIRELTLQ
jgi:predicted transcriptional regulator